MITISPNGIFDDGEAQKCGCIVHHDIYREQSKEGHPIVKLRTRITYCRTHRVGESLQGIGDDHYGRTTPR